MLNKKATGATWQSAVKLATLTTVLDDIVASYTRLLDARDTLRPKCVVVAHSYCYFQPTGRKATGPFGLRKAGPWMRPVLAAKGIDPDTEGREVARYLVDELHARLKALSARAQTFTWSTCAAPCRWTTCTGPTRSIRAARDSGGWRTIAGGRCSRRSFPAEDSTDA